MSVESRLDATSFTHEVARQQHRYHSIMLFVLLSNAIWIVFLSGWCVLYFIQAKADRKTGGRYPDYQEPRQ